MALSKVVCSRTDRISTNSTKSWIKEASWKEASWKEASWKEASWKEASLKEASLKEASLKVSPIRCLRRRSFPKEERKPIRQLTKISIRRWKLQARNLQHWRQVSSLEKALGYLRYWRMVPLESPLHQIRR